jgi:hypothetical protein
MLYIHKRKDRIKAKMQLSRQTYGVKDADFDWEFVKSDKDIPFTVAVNVELNRGTILSKA